MTNSKRQRGPRPANKPLPRGRTVLLPRIYGQWIARARARIGVHQIDLARQAGLQQATLSHLENAETMLAVFHLDVIADALASLAKQGGHAPPCGLGWEIACAVSKLAQGIADQGFTVVWAIREEDADALVADVVLASLIDELASG